MTTYYKGKIGQEEIEFGTGTFIKKDSNHANKEFTQINLGDIPRNVIPKTADYEITIEVGEYTFTNESASETITITLPSAKKGKGPFRFRVITSQELRIDPQDSDYFRDCAAGKYKSSSIAGNGLVVWCDVDNIWEYSVQIVTGNWDNET